MIPEVIRQAALIAIPVFHVLGFIAVAGYCLRTRRDATSTLLWLGVAWTFPIIGPLVFLTLGVTRVPAKVWRTQAAHDRFRKERQSQESEAMPLAYWRALRESLADTPDNDRIGTLARTMTSFGDEFPLLDGNTIEPLVTGDEAFPRMLAAIDAAQSHIHVQTYILGRDATGRTFLEHLARKARDGVEVRVLYDRIGSTSAWLRGMLRSYRGTPNLHIESWRQMDLFKWRFQINLRNHRKALIVDGNLAFTGGINLHYKNTTREADPPIRDYHFLIRGPIVHELQYTFLRDWHFMTDEDAGRLLCQDHFPRITPEGNSLIRLVNGGPASQAESITDLFCACLASARQQVLIVTPYFVPSPDIMRAIRLASLRGVEVKLVLPEHGNYRTVALAGQALYGDLLKAGISIFRRPEPLLHAKAMLVDDEIALVGTANMDNRSLTLNYETVLTVFDAEFANTLKRLILEDIAVSTRIDATQWHQRPAHQRVLENLCALLSPVL